MIFKFSLLFPCGFADKDSACNAGDLGSIPGCLPTHRVMDTCVTAASRLRGTKPLRTFTKRLGAEPEFPSQAFPGHGNCWVTHSSRPHAVRRLPAVFHTGWLPCRMLSAATHIPEDSRSHLFRGAILLGVKWLSPACPSRAVTH